MNQAKRMAALACLLLLIQVAPAAAQARAEPWMSLRAATVMPPPRETGRKRVGDVELYYAVYGKGPPVVLLHPGLGHGDDWANQVGPLSQEFEVVVVDLRGHGRSTGSDTPLSYALLAGDVARLIQKLHLGKAAIVGWGDGATVGLQLAIRHPRRVRELVAFGLTYDLAGQQEGVDKTRTFVDYVHKSAADFQRLSPEPERFDTRFRQLEALWLSEPRYTADDLKAIEVPVTIMAAEHDEWVKPGHMEAAAHLIPGAQVVRLNDASHFAPWQTPKAFNDVLKLILRY